MIYYCFTSENSKQLCSTLMVEKVNVKEQNWGLYSYPKTCTLTFLDERMCRYVKRKIVTIYTDCFFMLGWTRCLSQDFFYARWAIIEDYVVVFLCAEHPPTSLLQLCHMLWNYIQLHSCCLPLPRWKIIGLVSADLHQMTGLERDKPLGACRS